MKLKMYFIYLTASLGVTFITSLATSVLVVIITVAMDAIKNRIIVRVGMAFNAGIPCLALTVFSTINRKILIMVKGSGCPTRIGSVAGNTIGWKLRCCVVRVGGLIIIILMARYTIR